MGLGWNEMGWDGMALGWDGMGRDGMGWDWMGRDGTHDRMFARPYSLISVVLVLRIFFV